MASGLLASIGMSTLLTVSGTWDFTHARLSLTFGCGKMATSMSTLVHMWMTLLQLPRTPRLSLISCKKSTSSRSRVQVSSTSIWDVTLSGMNMEPCACLPGSALKNSWVPMSAFLVPSPSRMSPLLWKRHHPELDMSEELDANGIKYCQSLIGALQ